MTRHKVDRIILADEERFPEELYVELPDIKLHETTGADGQITISDLTPEVVFEGSESDIVWLWTRYGQHAKCFCGAEELNVKIPYARSSLRVKE